MVIRLKPTTASLETILGWGKKSESAPGLVEVLLGSPDFLFLTLFSRLLEFLSTDLCYKLGTREVVLPGPKASAAATIRVVLFVPKRTKLCC